MTMAPPKAMNARAPINDPTLGEKGGQYRTCAEDTQPGQQHSAMADPVRKRAHGYQQAGHQQRVDVDDPQNLGARCLQRKGQ